MGNRSYNSVRTNALHYDCAVHMNVSDTLITFAKEVMLSTVFVCLSASKITQNVFKRISWNL